MQARNQIRTSKGWYHCPSAHVQHLCDTVNRVFHGNAINTDKITSASISLFEDIDEETLEGEEKIGKDGKKHTIVTRSIEDWFVATANLNMDDRKTKHGTESLSKEEQEKLDKSLKDSENNGNTRLTRQKTH